MRKIRVKADKPKSDEEIRQNTITLAIEFFKIAQEGHAAGKTEEQIDEEIQRSYISKGVRWVIDEDLFNETLDLLEHNDYSLPLNY